jgi:hypothetical protein
MKGKGWADRAGFALTPAGDALPRPEAGRFRV